VAACGQASTPAQPPAGQPAAAQPTTAAIPTSVAAANQAVVAGTGQEIVVWSGQINFTDKSTPEGLWSSWIRDTFVQKNPKFSLKVEDHGWD